MQKVKEEIVDYDELTLNPLINNEIEAAEAAGEPDAKNKRRYWSAREEERFYEIWGRDNWRLTRHGKNTIYFAQWAQELRDRFNIDVKAEEVQTKVNQTRAKFRQVKKQAAGDKSGVARWKKFEIIDQILKNQYRPENAEPIPQEALRNNRDFTPGEVVVTPSAVAPTITPAVPAVNGSSGAAAPSEGGTPNELEDSTDVPNMVDTTLSAFDSSNEEQPGSAYEFVPSSIMMGSTVGDGADFPDEDEDFDVDDDEPPMLHQLQTPKQLLQQQQALEEQQQQQQLSYLQQQQPQQEPTVQPHIYQMPQQSHEANAHAVPSQMHFTEPPARHGVIYHNHNNTSNNNNNSTANQHVGTVPGVGTTNASANTNSTSAIKSQNNAHAMITPRPSAPRKRRTSSANLANNANNANNAHSSPSGETLETVYLEELRKKNLLLMEQKNIASKRLEVEERKVGLMEQFFPKCLELQQQILQKLEKTKDGSH